jgi:hypothetical protein
MATTPCTSTVVNSCENSVLRKDEEGGHLPRFFPCQPFYYPQLLLAASSCIIYILLAASHFKGPSHELMLTQRDHFSHAAPIFFILQLMRNKVGLKGSARIDSVPDL